MLSNKIVIQKINPNTGSVRLYQNFDLRSPWSFESYRCVSQNDSHPDIFPFIFDGSERFHLGEAGSETKVHMTKEGSLLFSDDYALPSGFVIGVLFPKGYVPEIFKFKDKPYIPTGVGIGGASIQPPGHFDLYINHEEQLSAVVFLITSNTYFGFKCIAKKYESNIPKKDRFPFYDDLFASFGFSESHPITISAKNLEEYKNHFSPGADLDNIAQLINELIESTRDNRISPETKQTTIQKLQENISTASSAVTILDSYASGNTVGQMVAKLISYLSL